MRFILLLLLAMSASAFDAKLFLPFESGNHNDTVDAIYMNANDIGTPPANWTLTGSAGVVDTGFNFPLLAIAVIEGNSYTGAGTRCIRISRGSEQSYQFSFASGQRTNGFVWEFWLRVTGTRSGFFDLATLAASGGDSATFQLNGNGYIPHTDFPEGAGAAMDLPHTNWHYFSIVFRPDGGDMDVMAWNTNGTVVGQSEWPISNTSAGVTTAQFGNVNPHGGSPSGDLYFDSMVSWWGDRATVIWPMGAPVLVQYRNKGKSRSGGLSPVF